MRGVELVISYFNGSSALPRSMPTFYFIFSQDTQKVFETIHQEPLPAKLFYEFLSVKIQPKLPRPPPAPRILLSESLPCSIPQVEEGGKQKTKIETHHKQFVLSSHISCSLGTSKAVMQLGMSTIITSASFVGRRRRILSLCMSSSQMRKQAEDS